MSATMRAIEAHGTEAEGLRLVEAERPEPAPGQIRIAVRAAGVNRPDIIQRRGFYPPPPGAPLTLGLEAAGVVEAVGAGVERWAVGDRVTALLGGGGYAEACVVDARHALPIPAGLSFEEAAALPETVFTVWANVFEAGALKPGETLMVHGATSGIGVTAIAMAKAHGARVIATGRGAAKAEAARKLGADLSLDASAGDFVPAVKEAGGADVILDMVGGDYVQRNLDCLNDLGRLVQIAFLGGPQTELNLTRLMMKRLTLTGSTLRSRAPEEKARLAAAVEATVWPWIEAGKLRPVIDRTFPLAEAGAAHAWLDAGGHVGKVVLAA